MSNQNTVILTTDDYSYYKAKEQQKENQTIILLKDKTKEELKQERNNYLAQGYDCYFYSISKTQPFTFKNKVGFQTGGSKTPSDYLNRM